MLYLPADDILPEIIALLRAGRNLVLEAPPGAGKTTRVPPAMLDAKLASDATRGEVWGLEPTSRVSGRATSRRCAANSAAVTRATIGRKTRCNLCSTKKKRNGKPWLHADAAVASRRVISCR